MKSLLRLLLRLLFRFRGYNEAVLKTPGPVLLVPNHVSWFDWLFIGVCLDDDWKFVVSSVVAQKSWLHRLIMVNRRTFPIDTASPYAVKRLAEHLQANGRLVLFAEGRISRTGTLMKLFDGTGFLLYKTPARVIACYLRGANRLPLCPHPGWRQWFPRVTAHFSEVLSPPKLEQISTTQARTKLTAWLRDQMVQQQFQIEMDFSPSDVLSAIVETGRRHPHQITLEDAARQPLTYRRLLTGALALSRPLASALTPGQERVGVLLPNVNALPVLLMSLWRLDRIPAILNFSSGTPVMLACSQLAGLKQIVTSRAFIERARLKLEPLTEAGIQFVYLEDLRAKITGVQKFLSLLQMTLNPRSLNAAPSATLSSQRGEGRGEGWVGQCRDDQGQGVDAPQSTLPQNATAQVPSPLNGAGVKGGLQAPSPLNGERAGVRGDYADDASQSTAVILFTSGSEGVPKGVELTHLNLLSNMRQMLATMDITDADRMFNCLPLFHSFGLTVGTLLPLVRGLYTFIYPSPLHYRMIPAAIYDTNCTIFLSTNTFLNGYGRKANAYDFRTVRYLYAAAEKLQEATAKLWSEKFGVRILEGYGATECSPCVSINTPLAPRYGSVGRLMPGMEYKLAPLEGVTDGAELFVRGPNIMRGYLNPDANAKFQALDGWYDTGDIVSIDTDGYLFIRGRLKRFAKVSGEMVSLTAVEDALAGAFPQYGLRCQVAVVTRPDEDKGEALIAVTNEPKLTLDEIRNAIKAKGLSNLSAPREIKVVKEIPKLGTGKINHRELAKMISEAK